MDAAAAAAAAPLDAQQGGMLSGTPFNQVRFE
jgi:hypothetical protein